MISKTEQKKKDLKVRVAMAMYYEYGKVPTEEEIESTYRLARVLYKAVLGTHFMRKQQRRNGQLVLF